MNNHYLRNSAMPLFGLGLWFNGSRDKNPFRKPNDRLPPGGNRKQLPPGMDGLILAILFLVIFSLALGAYRGVENVGPVDVFLMAMLALLLSRLVRGKIFKQKEQDKDWGRSRDEPKKSYPDMESGEEEEDEAEAYWRRREEEEMGGSEEDNDQSFGKKDAPSYDPWARYRSNPEQGASMKGNGQKPLPASKTGTSGFDRHEFITGAKILFEKVQSAMAGRDMTPVRSFLSEQAIAEIESIMQGQLEPQTCSILTVDASIKDILEKGETTTVSVAFNAMIHTGSDDAPSEVEVVWRFIRVHAQSNWQLDSLRA